MPMIMMALALGAQGTVLPADTREAVLTCGAAVRALPDSLSFDQTTVGMWFAMKGAALNSTNATMLDNIGPTMRDLMGRVDAIGSKRDAMLAECRKRFPMAWKTSGVVLPADDYERRLTCAFNTIALVPLAKGQERGQYFDRVNGLADRFTALLNDDELVAHAGTRTPTEEATRAMVSGLDLGNLAGIMNACEAAYPA
jgi:hypothetical protein